MKKKNVRVFGLLAMVLIFGMTFAGCAAYAALMDRTTPGWREMEPIQVFPGDSQGGGGAQQGGGTQGGGGTTVAQQPETITRSYTFSVPTGGQAGGGAAAVARSQAEAEATERFRRENPGFEIRNVQSNHDGLGTLTVTITGRRAN